MLSFIMDKTSISVRLLCTRAGLSFHRICYDRAVHEYRFMGFPRILPTECNTVLHALKYFYVRVSSLGLTLSLARRAFSQNLFQCAALCSCFFDIEKKARSKVSGSPLSWLLWQMWQFCVMKVLWCDDCFGSPTLGSSAAAVIYCFTIYISLIIALACSAYDSSRVSLQLWGDMTVLRWLCGISKTDLFKWQSCLTVLVWNYQYYSSKLSKQP